MTKFQNLKVIRFNQSWEKAGWVLIICLGLLFKLLLFPVATGDFVGFLSPWIDFIKSNGYASSLQYDFYDYTPTYIYILIGIAKLGLNPLYSIKIVSVIFEYILAFYIGRIAQLKYKGSRIIWISLAIIPILPTVILNSSYLSQCDSIYATFVTLSFFHLLKSKYFTSVLFLAIAFSFKMQTVMLLPLYFVFMLRGKIKWYYFLLIPAFFIISIIPAWLYGRPFEELIGIYITQSDRYRLLTMNFPNIYIWIHNSFYEPAKLGGIILTIIITLLSGFWLKNKNYQFNLDLCVHFAFLSAIVVPFCLPGMHERYMYLGDIFGVLYFLVLRKKLHLPLGIILVSLYSYIRCSRYNDILPIEPAFFLYLVILILTCTDFTKTLTHKSNENISQK